MRTGLLSRWLRQKCCGTEPQETGPWSAPGTPLAADAPNFSSNFKKRGLGRVCIFLKSSPSDGWSFAGVWLAQIVPGQGRAAVKLRSARSPGASSCLQHTAGNSQELVKMLNIHLSELCQAGIVSELCQAGIFSELCQAGIFSELCQAFQGCSPPLHYELFSVHWISSYHISISAAKNTSLISDVLPWANCTEIRIFLQHHMP